MQHTVCTHLAKVLLAKVCSATLNLIPHALHVVQIVGLLPVFGEQGSRPLCLLYLPCPELPFGSLPVHKPARHTDLGCWVILAAIGHAANHCCMQCWLESSHMIKCSSAMRQCINNSTSGVIHPFIHSCHLPMHVCSKPYVLWTIRHMVD